MNKKYSYGFGVIWRILGKLKAIPKLFSGIAKYITQKIQFKDNWIL